MSKSDAGAIWTNKGTNGKPSYLNGCIEHKGEIIRFSAYNNKFKTKKKQPDYIVFIRGVEEVTEVENIQEKEGSWWETHRFIL